MNRKYIGSEILKEYYKIAKKRIIDAEDLFTITEKNKRIVNE